jgi:hypothetical protein
MGTGKASFLGFGALPKSSDSSAIADLDVPNMPAYPAKRRVVPPRQPWIGFVSHLLDRELAN